MQVLPLCHGRALPALHFAPHWTRLESVGFDLCKARHDT